LSEEQFSFHLSTDEHRRLRKLAYASGLPPFYQPVMATLFGLQFVATLLAHGHSFWTAVSLLVTGVGCGIMLAAIANARFRRLAVEGCLTFSESGLSGTVDGVPAAIRWLDIAGVRDLDDAIVITRRHGLGAIAIPKVRIANCGALWAEFKDRLVSKRGLIRSGIRTTVRRTPD
jgi:hypothetical protein